MQQKDVSIAVPIFFYKTGAYAFLDGYHKTVPKYNLCPRDIDDHYVNDI